MVVKTTQLKVSSVSISELSGSSYRFDAEFYGPDARHARDLIRNLDCEKVGLTDKLFVESATYPLRFKRNYVSKDVGDPFLLPSQVTEILPLPYKWIIPETDELKSELLIDEGDILLTRSGSVGKCSIANNSFVGSLLSDDLIRIKPKAEYRGLIFTFLTSEIGQTLLSTSPYGAVIKHLEPEHLEHILIPIPEKPIVKKINELVETALADIDKSNVLISRSKSLLLESLNLSTLSSLHDGKMQMFLVEDLWPHVRMDGSFHNPLVNLIEKHFKKCGISTLPLGDDRISEEIILPGRFRRVYVESDYGVPLIGGKQILNLDPRTEKFLALLEHADRVKEELEIKENQVLVTCSGTIGKVTLAPSFWSGWAASQHILRIQAKDELMSAYIYAWLSSEFGRLLIERFTYGAVVDEITDIQLAEVLIPILEESAIKEIAEPILLANRLRTKAFLGFQEASKVLDSVLYENS